MSDERTQKQKVKDHLEEYGSITPLEALNNYGIMRLSARIHELRKETGTDYEIITDMGAGNYATYELKEKEEKKRNDCLYVKEDNFE